MPDADRTALDQLLGSGVVGDPVDAGPLATADIPLRAGTWTYQVVSGKKKGQTEDDVLTQLERDPSGASWKLAIGTNDVAFIQIGDDQSLTIVSEQDTDQGVITRFTPAEPIVTTGMSPGDSKEVTIGVKVYDLSSPDEVSHSGSLDLDYSYVGAYKVTVPAGSYDAALLKWDYEGSVGPASVERHAVPPHRQGRRHRREHREEEDLGDAVLPRQLEHRPGAREGALMRRHSA